MQGEDGDKMEELQMPANEELACEYLPLEGSIRGVDDYF